MSPASGSVARPAASAENETISLSDAEALLHRALVSHGVRDESALSVAKALVAAEAEGQAGHGFSRLADYIAQARSGKVKADAVPKLISKEPGAILVDAGNGFAYPALDLAIAHGIAAAKNSGCASISVTRSHHCGALSVQVQKIAEAGCVGIMVANAPAAIAPWGAKVPVFGTNPIAFAVPRLGAEPLVIDLSLSRVARGKVMHAKKSGTTIPHGWALDKDGVPTTDPEAALEGTMVPIGEAKGTALALMVEILAATFTGAQSSREASSFFSAEGPPPGTGQFLLALRPHDIDAFRARLERLISVIDVLDGARLPGERRKAALAAARAHGLQVPKHYLDQARALASDNG
ncbi:MAG: Ldh family oxidoreductase [Pseudomonadota bacterium]